MPKSVHMILQGWRRKPSTFKHRAWNLASSCLFWTFVEGEELKIIEWVGAVHGEDKDDAS